MPRIAGYQNPMPTRMPIAEVIQMDAAAMPGHSLTPMKTLLSCFEAMRRVVQPKLKACLHRRHGGCGRRRLAEVAMIAHDITRTNRAVRLLIESTHNARHRFLLMAYDRHRNLEMAGRYEELFAPDMMVKEPVYHLNAHGSRLTLKGAEAVKSLYRMWAATNQAVFYVESEQLAVADNFIASVAVGFQQVSGGALFFDKVLSYLPASVSRYVAMGVLAAKTDEAR